MTLNGIWKAEIFGPYGWEPMATVFLEDGVYKVGGRNHYEVGSYEVTDNRIVATFRYITHGKARTMLGKKAKEMDLKMNGTISTNQINGHVMEDGGNFQVVFRATRLADLP